MKTLSKECQLIIKHILRRAYQYNINKHDSEQISITIGRIQRILYFAQIEHIKHTGNVMFEDDFYALPLGPEIKEVREFYIDYTTGRSDILTFPIGKLDIDKRKIVDIILDNTNEIDTVTLSKYSRTIDNLWINAYRCEDSKNDKLISKREIINYYKPKNKTKTKKRAKRDARYYKQNTINK